MSRALSLIVAYSYIRFSTPDQARGDSVRRQIAAVEDWCARHGARLDTSTTYLDLAKSAFLGEHRKNPDRHALAAFLKLVEGGKIPRGSYLIIESLDRLTREHVRAGLMLLLSLIEAGIRIVQLSPSEVVFDEKSDEMGLMLAIVELSRGHRESKRKSDMIGAVWAKFRQGLGQGGNRRTPGRLPAWVAVAQGGALALIPERAAAIVRIYELAAAGYGLTRIVKQLDAENVKPFGPAGRWVRGYVGLLLRDRRVLGELQPRRGSSANSRPEGEPIPDFFPRVVSEALWNAARGELARRRAHPGRIGKYVNLFTGLLKDARTATPVYMTNNVAGRVLFSRAADEGRAPKNSFPLATLETAVLDYLREIDPHEILNGDQGPDETMQLAGQLASVEAELAGAAAFMEANGFSPTIGKRIAALEAQKRDLAEQLALARQRAAHPLSEAWGECQSLADVLASAADPDDARLRLRSALRRIVEEIWMLVVVPRGHDRLCAVQIWFAGGKRHRDYLVLYRPPKNNGKTSTPGGCWPLSFAAAALPDDLDLRKPAHVRNLERVLLALDLPSIFGEICL